MIRALIRGPVLAVSLAALVPASWALPSLYRVTDLGPDSAGTHINLSGEVSGTDARGLTLTPALWIGGVLHDLPDPFTSAEVAWVNTGGVAVGWAGTSTFTHAVLWTSPTSATDIGGAFGSGSFGTAINDNGDCTIDVPSDTWHTYVSPSCTGANYYDIGSLGGGQTFSVAINSNGQVAGTSNQKKGPNRQRAYLYTAGTMKNLGVLSGYLWSDGRGLNGKGHVVGRCVDSAKHSMGYFHDGTKMASVGTLGGAQSFAEALNYFDVVVGEAQAKDKSWHAVVRDMSVAGSVMLDLGKMLDSSGAGWTLQDAVGINNNGQILVKGFVAGDNALRSAVLTPID